MTLPDSRAMSSMTMVCPLLVFLFNQADNVLPCNRAGPAYNPEEGRAGSRAPSVEMGRNRQASRGYENESNYGRDRQPSIAYNQTMPWNDEANLSDMLRRGALKPFSRNRNGADLLGLLQLVQEVPLPVKDRSQ